ncbi:uncharacterized protein Z518_01421 [Rhinocladiella mackenziei CBS 650.93]|uniref:Mitochondrial pyruvate carrier n=1 Tax=Rhinocladiella mackenziei CBS 650.93 TaxID=1442369 RepID=A0A0D2IWE6_9EURO|nr:uncharacterized protein Z518_01421 [Rhinocladiella mackenziei CBS 650.93]KIX10339.1 hypothetical protein Z518_01421 [Rhinocladiella mackenziei CBS 650.93]
MSARFGVRFAQQTSRQTSFATRTPFKARNPIFRRYQGTAANPAVDGAPPQSLFQKLWTSEVGIRTVHFWYGRIYHLSLPHVHAQVGSANNAKGHPAKLRNSKSATNHMLTVTFAYRAPIMKWGVVLAGASDFLRPADKLSLTQNLALMATGSIWTRWCFIIRPQNMLLAAVNFCLFVVGFVQCSRIFLYQKGTTGALKEMEQEVGGSVKSVEKKVEQKL